MKYIDNAYSIISEMIGNWVETFINMLPNFVVAVLALVIFYFVSRLVVALLAKTVFRFSQNIAVNKLIASLTRIAIMTAGLFVALGILELDKTVTSLLAGVGIMGLAIGFAFNLYCLTKRFCKYPFAANISILALLFSGFLN